MQCITMQCMEEQITFRLPKVLARALARRARQRGVPKSLLVREAVHAYLGQPLGGARPAAVWERIAPFAGSVRSDRASAEQDALTQRLRQHNWRE